MGKHHWAIRPTQQAAMIAATEAAKKRAKSKGTCYKPAWVINKCTAVPGGVKCMASSANEYGTCEKRGWFNPSRPWPEHRFVITVYPLPWETLQKSNENPLEEDWEEDGDENCEFDSELI